MDAFDVALQWVWVIGILGGILAITAAVLLRKPDLFVAAALFLGLGSIPGFLGAAWILPLSSALVLLMVARLWGASPAGVWAARAGAAAGVAFALSHEVRTGMRFIVPDDLILWPLLVGIVVVAWWPTWADRRQHLLSSPEAGEGHES